jgi:hypothetical protein
MFDLSNLIPKFQDILGLQIPKVGIHLKMAGLTFLHPSTFLFMYVVVCLKSPHTLPTHFPYHVLTLVVSLMLRCTMRNGVICNWPCNWVFELQWPLATSLQLSVFLWHECYHKNSKSCNRHNSSFVEPYMYVTHATRLPLCKNNHCATIIQPCNYCCNDILMLSFIHPSMMDFVVFCCNSFATIGVVKTR